MKRIDLENWSGRGMFRQFAGMDVPFFSVTVPLDITFLLEKARAENLPFFGLSLFAIARALNAVEALRYRLLPDGEIVLYEKIDPVYLALREDEAITAVRVPFANDFAAFDAARREAEKRTLAMPEPWFYRGDERDVFFLSAVPWFSFSGMSHPIMLGKKYDSIVRLTLGKYRWQDGKAIMSLDIQSHHGFVDGFRLAQFFREIERFGQEN
ncbi:CatA-like O-acetyltransferase [Oxalobacter paraformigenes]|nr:CatA-like O-acetyltransferase [Oxalobacter paraformigenes]